MSPQYWPPPATVHAVRTQLGPPVPRPRLVSHPPGLEGRTGVPTVDEATASIADLATVPGIGISVANQLLAVGAAHTRIGRLLAHPPRIEAGASVGAVDSASATITHLSAIARPGGRIARGRRADTGAAHAHVIFAQPARLEAGAAVATREGMAAAIRNVATIGATGGPGGVGALVGGFAVRPADADVLDRIARPSGGAVVAAVDIAIAAVTDQAAIGPAWGGARGGRYGGNAGVSGLCVGDDQQGAASGTAGGLAACAAHVPAANTAIAPAASCRHIGRTASPARSHEECKGKQTDNCDPRL